MICSKNSIKAGVRLPFDSKLCRFILCRYMFILSNLLLATQNDAQQPYQTHYAPFLPINHLSILPKLRRISQIVITKPKIVKTIIRFNNFSKITLSYQKIFVFEAALLMTCIKTWFFVLRLAAKLSFCTKKKKPQKPLILFYCPL